MPRKKKYDYDVALSFAGEDRAIAEELAQLLRNSGARVFYDEFEKATLWGKDLYQHLQKIYQQKARYCVVFVSAAYVKKNWTKHELKHAQARSFESEREYILPLRIDDTALPGLAPTVGYLDLRQHSIGQVGLLLLNKLGLSSDHLMEEAARAGWEGDFVEYNGTKVASFWPQQLEASQRKPFVLVTRPMDRIRFGKETWWKKKKVITPCHDCAAVVGQLHGPACDMEQCPACFGQWIGCGCRHETVTDQQATAWEEQEDEVSK